LKFFKKKFTIFNKKTTILLISPDNTIYDFFIEDKDFVFDFKIKVTNFINFFFKKGLKKKYKKFLSFVILNFNYFIASNYDYIKNSYPSINSLLSEMLFQGAFYNIAIEPLLVMLEPPFVVKTVPTTKKMKKKTKKKFLIKIVYLKSDKRLNSSIKQLHYYMESFEDSKFKVRLYKSILITFLN